MKYQRHSVHNTKGKKDAIMDIRRYDIVQAVHENQLVQKWTDYQNGNIE